MKVVHITNGIIHFNESKADCPYCTRHVDFNELEEKWCNSKNAHLRHKCKGCKRFMGITQDMKGDFRCYELKSNK